MIEVAFSGTVEEYLALVQKNIEEKERAEGEFLEALKAGKVLVECWGNEDRVKIWHGNEYGIEKTAVHVASRFRAGWTKVKTASLEEMKMPAKDLPKLQRCLAWDGKEYVRVMIMEVIEQGENVKLDCVCWIGHPSFIWTVPANTMVQLI